MRTRAVSSHLAKKAATDSGTAGAEVPSTIFDQRGGENKDK